jgi:hypothetical protein
MVRSRVHFLGDLHGADLSGVGRAGAAGDDDGGDQRRQFAQHGQRHQFNDEDVGAIGFELLTALIGDHNSHHERQQGDDRQRVDAGGFDVAEQRPPAEPAGMQRQSSQGRRRLANEGQKSEGTVQMKDDRPPQPLQSTLLARRRRQRSSAGAAFLHQVQ